MVYTTQGSYASARYSDDPRTRTDQGVLETTWEAYCYCRSVRARSRRVRYDIEGHHHKDSRASCTSLRSVLTSRNLDLPLRLHLPHYHYARRYCNATAPSTYTLASLCRSYYSNGMPRDMSLRRLGYALGNDNYETSRGRNVRSSLSLWFVELLRRDNKLGRTVVVSCSVEVMQASDCRFIIPNGSGFFSCLNVAACVLHRARIPSRHL
jgi:hypothetical protein